MQSLLLSGRCRTCGILEDGRDLFSLDAIVKQLVCLGMAEKAKVLRKFAVDNFQHTSPSW